MAESSARVAVSVGIALEVRIGLGSVVVSELEYAWKLKKAKRKGDGVQSVGEFTNLGERREAGFHCHRNRGNKE